MICEEITQENLDSLKMDNVLRYSSDEHKLNRPCLMANEQIGDSNSSDDDDGGNISEEEEEEEHEILDEVYNGLNKFSKLKVAKVLLHLSNN